MTGGIGLLALEMFFIDTGFYLVFLGLSGAAVGLCMLAVGGAPASVQWLLFGAFSLLSVLGFRRKLYERIHESSPEVSEGVAGEWALASEPIEAGAMGRVELRGSPWSARNIGEKAIERGGRVLVVRTEGLVLLVRPDTH
jgi:membrane protein implicated in regulation of membrane protease activity